MLTHFLRAVFIRGSIFNVLREERERETPQTKPRSSVPPRGKQVTAVEINGLHLNDATAIVNFNFKK
ncbi:hypothetical protein PBF_13524 [Cytobacillus firmus DS1]|uniref:Uncharacterized protein n=1 Tax=Cytobacillus firmus DS1 TaxID=1307436 RepID=W7KWK9_CYTFI|nr:hypothetical protein PBF_13524 [Cytobacillus firmus DS1]